ncbi:hypothetical protein BDN70DRAFT_870405 [Pholiota conissans]|uniref:Uncharacterized protein n=1 Tax=Pholiota conissans TaxID=109636 RepID=A0A9P5ZCZ0_9AGAR|nr:hypothetical protein BDN70DRAFT_870405 [Pholiota conissans]
MASRESPVKSHSESLTDLSHSSNMFAAGIGEVLQAFVASTNPPNTKPIMVEYANRIMAIGRGRLSAMNGRNALLYLKSKFGLLNSTAAVFVQATFEEGEGKFVEVDLDSWEELVGHMYRLRIL